MSNNLQPRSIMHKISKMGSSTKSISPISLKKKLSDNTTGSVTDHESCCSSVSFDEHEPRQGFETLNQNEFVDRVLIDGCNDLDMIVHFYNEDTTFSFHIEEKLLKIVQQPSRCDFVLYRIEASMAPYFTSKLQIDASKTTVLRFKNGHDPDVRKRNL
eukprot:scaffold2557_cov121-Cylindrotheca_fusiformis.AAC.6